MKLNKILKLRRVIEQAAESLDDAAAVTAPELFKTWKPGVDYITDERFQHDGVLYKVLQPHTSQENWLPGNTPSLYARVLIPDPDVIPEWEQPDSTNAYMKGDRVSHIEKIWTSTIDNNVWEPGVYGWEED